MPEYVEDDRYDEYRWEQSDFEDVPPETCPVCDNPTAIDEDDPTVGIFGTVCYCEVCDWQQKVS